MKEDAEEPKDFLNFPNSLMVDGLFGCNGGKSWSKSFCRSTLKSLGVSQMSSYSRVFGGEGEVEVEVSSFSVCALLEQFWVFFF